MKYQIMFIVSMSLFSATSVYSCDESWCDEDMSCVFAPCVESHKPEAVIRDEDEIGRQYADNHGQVGNWITDGDQKKAEDRDLP
ncbi:MAG: hypothetical protein WCE21_04490 [Candidatus Babeliales bacterium]